VTAVGERGGGARAADVREGDDGGGWCGGPEEVTRPIGEGVLEPADAEQERDAGAGAPALDVVETLEQAVERVRCRRTR
jgi:hypothetical protein